MKQQKRVRLAAGMSILLLSIAPLYVLAVTGTFVALSAQTSQLRGSTAEIAGWPWYLLIGLAGLSALAHVVLGIAAFADRRFVKPLRRLFWLDAVMAAVAVVQAFFLPNINGWDVLTLASFLVAPVALSALTSWLARDADPREASPGPSVAKES